MTIDMSNIPDEIKTIADAITINNRASNRLWLVSASTTLVLASVIVEAEKTTLFGIKMNADTLYFVAIVVLVVLLWALAREMTARWAMTAARTGGTSGSKTMAKVPGPPRRSGWPIEFWLMATVTDGSMVAAVRPFLNRLHWPY